LSHIAHTHEGKVVVASEFELEAWESLKRTASPSTFVMACCGARAVAKTSINGCQVFAHYAGECDTAPESVWHFQAKALVVDRLRSMGRKAEVEFTGSSRKWIADVAWSDGRQIKVIELQRSPQTLKEYEHRQRRYNAEGVRAHWLLFEPCALVSVSKVFWLRWPPERTANRSLGDKRHQTDAPGRALGFEAGARLPGAFGPRRLVRKCLKVRHKLRPRHTI
jgi:competence protein CoiA